MKRAVPLVCVLVLLLGELSAGKAETRVWSVSGFSDQAIEQAIARGVEYLLSKQLPDGNWPPYTAPVQHHATGPTALAVYALLESGVSVQHPQLAKALNWLVKTPENMTYSLALRCNAWLVANRQTNGKYAAHLYRDARMLWTAGAGGAYDYPSGRPGRWDNSNSQFGLLGVWAKKQWDGEVPGQYWRAVMSHWERTQLPSGGWPYRNKGKVARETRGTMTAGGVASLFVCFDNLYASRFITCGRSMTDYKPIARGLEWFDKNFASSIAGAATMKHGFYYLYGVERVGLACGYKYFGEQDWYKIGTRLILGSQRGDGGWCGPGNVPMQVVKPAAAADAGPWEVFAAKKKKPAKKPAMKGPESRPHEITDTCFALLFLVRGRHPVLFNKLQFDGDWNNRPRDMASLTRWISRAFEKTVNWQIVNLKVPVRELHEAPILYISAAKAPKFSTEELDKLREYVWQGGCLFSVRECTGTGFKKGIREVYAKLFPQYELVPAGPDHEIYNAHFKLRGKPAISILSNGVRPLAIHTDVDVSRDWQMQRAVTHKKSFQVAANVFMYVTDYGELRYRGTSHWPTGQAGGGGGIKIVRLKHNGNCNPEPLAHTRFELMMGGAVTVSEPTPIAQLASTDARIALMTGTGRFGLTKADKQAIKDFVTGGGTLVIDAAGGPRFRPDPKAGIDRISGFAADAERMLEGLFGRRSLRPLPATSPILAQVGKVKCRRRTRKRLVGKLPTLRVIMVGGRAAVFYSREDITAGLAGYDCATVDGYRPESAFAILRSIVLFASSGSPVGSGAGSGAGSFSPPGKSIAEPTERIEL